MVGSETEMIDKFETNSIIHDFSKRPIVSSTRKISLAYIPSLDYDVYEKFSRKVNFTALFDFFHYAPFDKTIETLQLVS